MPVFSLLIPTRMRIDYVERMLGSLTDNTDNHNRVEILFMIDDDDIITNAYLCRCKHRFPFSIRIFERQRSDFLNRDYYNELAERAKGEFCWVIGDDLMFVKKGWDTLLINEINNYLKIHKTRVLYIGVKDDVERPPGAPAYANFPLISSEGWGAIGYLMPPSIPSWTGDYLIYLVYSHQAVDRILQIPELILSHTNPNDVTMVEADGQTNRQRNIYSRYKVKERADYWEAEVLPSVRGKLAAYIEKHKDRRPYYDLT